MRPKPKTRLFTGLRFPFAPHSPREETGYFSRRSAGFPAFEGAPSQIFARARCANYADHSLREVGGRVATLSYILVSDGECGGRLLKTQRFRRKKCRCSKNL